MEPYFRHRPRVRWQLQRRRHHRAQRMRSRRRALPIDDYELDGFVREAEAFGSERYAYVVTPNADHLLRLQREPEFRRAYAQAAYILFDSRFLAHLLRLTRGLRLPVCTGSDLTGALLDKLARPQDRILLIGGSVEQAARLAARYDLHNLAHYNPPMGFAADPRAVEACLDFIEARSPFRFCFLAVGAPRQEMLALRLRQRGRARGLVLCIGASVDFLTGKQTRAPLWMQTLGLEWLHRLCQNPARMARRYLWEGPQLLAMLGRIRFQLRAATPRPAAGQEPPPIRLGGEAVTARSAQS